MFKWQNKKIFFVQLTKLLAKRIKPFLVTQCSCGSFWTFQTGILMFKKKIKQHVLLKQLELLQNSSVPGSLLVAVVSSEALRWTIKAKFPFCLQGGLCASSWGGGWRLRFNNQLRSVGSWALPWLQLWLVVSEWRDLAVSGAFFLLAAGAVWALPHGLSARSGFPGCWGRAPRAEAFAGAGTLLCADRGRGSS